MSQAERQLPPRERLPSFLRRGKISAFLTIVLSGQIVYSAFEAFKGSLMLPLQQVLGISAAQYGLLMGYTGITLFFYIPAGWVLNRVNVRTIVFWSLLWRLTTYGILFLAQPSFEVMIAIAISWGIVDAVMWPAVVNGVSLIAKDDNSSGRGLAMGLLESIRRFAESVMNLLIIAALIIWADHTEVVMKTACISYALLLIPLMYCVRRYFPPTPTAHMARHSDSAAALLGLLRVLRNPRVWLASLTALTLYWSYINLIYCSAPFLNQVFGVPQTLSAVFGVLDTGVIAIVAGVISGYCADYVFRSSTKVVAIALGMVAVTTIVILALPTGPEMLWLTLGLLIVVGFATFFGKSLLLAPVAELGLPDGISGSAIAVGAFLAYASTFWAYPMNGYIIDEYASQPADGYRLIFMVTLIIAGIGCACAAALTIWNRRAVSATEAS